jgi:hypothetical protein
MKGLSIKFIMVSILVGLFVGSNTSYSAEVPQWVIDRAYWFAGFHTTVSTIHPRINCSHTYFYEVHGISNIGGTDRQSVVIVGGSESYPEVVGYVRLCPRYDDLSDINNYTAGEVIVIGWTWLNSNHLIPPPDFHQETPVLRKVGEELRWEISWTHEFTSGSDTGRVVPDFILVEVDAEEGEVITYSKVHHSIAVDTYPNITASEALAFARDHLNTLGYDSTLRPLSTELTVVYPNDYFTDHHWEWSDDQHLCWIVQFGDSLDALHPSEPGIDIWVEANGAGGELRGGEIYETPVGELYGIPNQQSDTNIQKPYLERMQYDLTGKIHQGNTTETNITNSISDANNFLFILHTHGGAWDNLEHAVINGSGGDAGYFSSDEVPNHTLHYALMSFCHSGDEKGNNDFKEEFIAHHTGTSYFSFQGYVGSIDPDQYEDREFYHLSKGETLENAHSNAKTETGITFAVVFTYVGSCYNHIRLAPLFVDVSEEPEECHLSGDTFYIHVDVTNNEDAGSTEATGVNVQLVVPSGFAIISGANPQNLGSINYGIKKTATWQLSVTTATPGTHTFDAIVWSDNLGVELDDPDDSYYHREDVAVKAKVPTLNESGLVILFAVLALTAIFLILRQRKRQEA